MPRPYDLGVYLTVAEKFIATQAKYRRCPDSPDYPGWETEAHQCPLGVIFEAEAPTAIAVAEMIQDTRPWFPMDTLITAAQAFIDDWDSGALQPEDLAVALRYLPE